ncbi:hypothetical protein BD410DRAFT_782403 [Rickenella mellea]|uniref:Protein PNS1 n=1 Tax=Rickenella mellea TaxID=50990 RepID=A0A4Y7QI46_9AGAM|nr:hypothetical protein BD410DRAFT_782403 [Rickenella mellea]
MDDEGDPHLRGSDSGLFGTIGGIEDEDPYLRLDEEESPVAGPSSRGVETLPLVSSHRQSTAREPLQGWLAHQVPVAYRTPSPSPSEASSEDEQSPRDDIYPSMTHPINPPPPTRTALSLTESLLPRDGNMRPVDTFSLPDPRRLPRGRRRYNDSPWTAVWCFSISACFIGSILILFTTSKPPNSPKGSILPYTTMLRAVPLMTVLTFLSAAVSYAHIMLLRMFVRPMLYATYVFIPATLFISALWAFIGSFMWDGDTEPTWGETTGLRLFSIVPLVLAFITSRRLMTMTQEIHTTSSILKLATEILIANPLLLALSPLILILSLIGSIPFVTLVFRLLLIGYFPQPLANSTPMEWHLRNWAGWAITGTMGVWLWSWGIGRGILRTTSAGVVAAWYFRPPHVATPPPMSTHDIHAALFRATSPSLGTVVLSALLLAGVRLLAITAALIRRAPMPLLPWLSLPLSIIGNLSQSLSTHVLIYTGITGDAFFSSARRARALTAASDNLKGALRRIGGDPSLAILNLTPLTLTLPFALTTYLFVAHALMSPNQATFAAFLAGGVTALVGLFCIGLVEDTADTLYLCYCIDRDTGEMHRTSVFSIFENKHRRYPSPPAVPSPSSSDPEQRGNERPPSLIQESPRKPMTELPPDVEHVQPTAQSYLANDNVEEPDGDEGSVIGPGSDFFN